MNNWILTKARAKKSPSKWLTDMLLSVTERESIRKEIQNPKTQKLFITHE